ncbi:ATP-dependent DNA helicase UvrD2 [Nitriliruptoraceae bacterium ZYF776]|nr:ATP-dependent DNA helicase UvrD2 [Profundirhabdus halotolerans]
MSAPPTTTPTGSDRVPEVDRDGVGLHLVDGGAAAARALAIVRDRLEEGAATTDVVVLARVNSALLPIQVALTDAGIGHSAPLDASVLGRTGLRTALAYLRLGLDPDRMRREDLLDTLNRPARKVKSAIQPFLKRSQRWSMGQLESILDQLDGIQHERFAGYLGDLHHLTHAITEGADTARVLWLVRNRIGLGDAMEALDSSRTRPEGSSHGDDLDALQQLADDHPDPVTFRERLVERLRVPADPQGVTLSTVHRVKGLEWDHVVVVAANDGLFPHRLSEDVEEERRVFHVAITRCRRRVDVVADRTRPSPFLGQLLADATARPRERDRRQGLPDEVAPTAARDGAVVAEVGLPVALPGGLSGRIVEVDGDVAVVAADSPVGELVTRVPFGAPVRVADRATSLAAKPKVTTTRGATPAGGRLLDVADDGPADPALLEALKAWRTRTAQATNSPAFLVFHDRTLTAIAARKPGSVRELGAIPGVGPAKLERYADDLLELLDAHR